MKYRILEYKTTDDGVVFYRAQCKFLDLIWLNCEEDDGLLSKPHSYDLGEVELFIQDRLDYHGMTARESKVVKLHSPKVIKTYRVMKQGYRVIERDNFYTAQYKSWWFPYRWIDCYGFNSCCYAESAKVICDIHSEGESFNEDQLDWAIQQLDHQHEHFLNSKS